MLVLSQYSQIRKFPFIIPTHTFRNQYVPLNRLTAILISRFLLNLQAAEHKSTGMISSTGSQVESALFQGVIGSLGSEIEFGADFDVNGIEDGGRAGDGGVDDVKNSLSGLEHTEESAAEEAVTDD